MALSTLMVGACSSPSDPTPPYAALQLVLNEKQAQWDSLHANHYSFDFEYKQIFSHLEGLTFTVEVQSDSIISILNHATNQMEDPSAWPTIPTINEMFKLVQNAIDRNYYKISVKFNSTSGYPEMIGFDPEKQMADDEYGMTAGNLVIH
ncbi:MAG: hypothetical protein JNN04_13270 [Cyclobacteriaceae bacterium]|nr:hypothetical protein [Cyclobacteriaceae bacterium]